MKKNAFVIAFSLALHLAVAVSFYQVGLDKPVPVKLVKVKISIMKSKQEEPKTIAKKIPVIEEKPKKKSRPKQKKKKPKKPVERQSNKKPVKNAQRVQGVSKKSTVAKGAGISVPLGNTLMEKDKGLRLKDEQIEGLKKDLSQDPRLVDPSQARLKYTPDAEDAGLEGRFVVEVYVDENGDVIDFELERKIGYGMDSVVIEAAKKAKFFPRRNIDGKALKAWTSITFDLVLE